jgi:hypothetical protein
LEVAGSLLSYSESAAAVPEPVKLAIYCQSPFCDSSDKGGNGSFPDPRTGDSRCPSILDVRIVNSPPILLQSHHLRPVRLYPHPASAFCGLPQGPSILLTISTYREKGFLLCHFPALSVTGFPFRFSAVFPESANGSGLWCFSHSTSALWWVPNSMHDSQDLKQSLSPVSRLCIQSSFE